MEKPDDVALAELIMEDYLADLEQIVNIDSGTYTKAGVDRVGAYLQERFHSFGST
jgi:glutamate carboxypeptidase